MRILLLALMFLPLGAPDVMVELLDDVKDPVKVHRRPSLDEGTVGSLLKNEQATLLGSVPNWRLVQLPGGARGYVPKSRTRIVTPGQPPDNSERFFLDVVDVGSGLAVLVRGEGWTLLFDGGSDDDGATGAANRLSAYIRATAPSLKVIDHLILSHPHEDHVNLLPDLFKQHDVHHVWDSGRVTQIEGYRSFIKAVAAAPACRYHYPQGGPGSRQFPFKNNLGQETISLQTDARIDEVPITLGPDARMTFVYSDNAEPLEVNANSLVVRLDLGEASVLLMGDAEAATEKRLLACCKSNLAAHVLVVGHHGSKSGTTKDFLKAVNAPLHLISAGPRVFAGKTLPHAEVVSAIKATGGQLWTTRVDDEQCRTSAAKIGTDSDNRPGGCSSIRVAITACGSVKASWVGGPD